METVKFLRDIEDETVYAQGLEMAYIDAFNAITKIGNAMSKRAAFTRSANTPAQQKRGHELRKVLSTMALVIRDCAHRRKRLANIAAGLTDVVFDEEGLQS